MQYDKVTIAFRSVAIMGALQVINIIATILSIRSSLRLFPRVIDEMLHDTFICRVENTDVTIVYYLFQRLYLFHVINTILIIGTVMALILYFIKTKSTSSIVLICLNIALCSITVVPYLIIKNGEMVTRLAVYDFAYFTASYQNVPFITIVYAVLLAGYAWFLVSHIRKNSKSRIAVCTNGSNL